MIMFNRALDKNTACMFFKSSEHLYYTLHRVMFYKKAINSKWCGALGRKQFNLFVKHNYEAIVYYSFKYFLIRKESND